jgi:6-pyruvoyltetrahydropterin/6-carboxytetrahydropterin synthase
MHKIRIEKQKLNFSAAHFITYENECESLHGHNYYTVVEIAGIPDENNYLIDFTVLKGKVQVLCDSLEHKVLMAMKNPHLKISEKDGQFEVCYRDKKYSFPVGDVVQLPIPNTTVEMLSEYLCQQLKGMLEKKGYLSRVTSMEVGVEETAGQMASYRMDF